MKYLPNKKAACLFVGETQFDTCAVRGTWMQLKICF